MCVCVCVRVYVHIYIFAQELYMYSLRSVRVCDGMFECVHCVHIIYIYMFVCVHYIHMHVHTQEREVVRRVFQEAFAACAAQQHGAGGYAWVFVCI